jgi:integrase
MPGLDSKAIDFRAASESFAAVRKLARRDLETLRIVTDHQGRKVPTVDGMILFSKDRERHFPAAALRLRVKDIDFVTRIILVRGGKKDVDRRTMLPRPVIEPLQEHLIGVRRLHEADLDAGLGEVWLPHALGRKYPNAGKEWGWQYAFPASYRSIDPRSGTSAGTISTSRPCRRRSAGACLEPV